jgi:hypothetical protein
MIVENGAYAFAKSSQDITLLVSLWMNQKNPESGSLVRSFSKPK